MAKPIVRIDKMRESDFENLAMRIVENIEGNDHYPEPLPPLALLKDQLATYRSARAAAANRDTYLVEIRKQARKTLEESLRLLAYYVQQQAGSDRAILLTSGFNLTKEREAAGPRPKPELFRIEHLAPGRVKLKVKAGSLVSSYAFEYRKKGAEAWEKLLSTKSSVVLDGLESGQCYEFRVAYVGSHPSRIYSDVISSYVL